MTEGIFIAIALSAIVTASVRALPIILLTRFETPAFFRDWLGFVPIAIMAAIVSSELLNHPQTTAGGRSLSLAAAGVAVGVGFLTRSLFMTVIAGVVAFMELPLFLK